MVDSQAKQKMILAALAVLMIGVVFSGWQLYLSTTFRVTKTDPKLSAVSAISPYLRVYFSNGIKPSSLAISDPNEIIKSTDIAGKTVTFKLDDSLSKDVNYQIIIKSIANTEGETITNKVFSFTARDIGYDKLSKGQKSELMEEQTDKPYNITFMTFTNFDELLTYGMTSDQLDAIKNEIYNYSNTINKQFREVNLNTGSLKVITHSRQNPDPTDQAYFTIATNNTSYQVQVRYSVLSSGVSLRILDKNGAQLYANQAQ